MMPRSEMKAFLNNEPRFDDIMCSLKATAKQPKGIIREMEQVIAVARKFNQEVTRPYVSELDLKMHQDPDYLPWDFVKKAAEWGFYSMFIPKIFGGKGFNLSCMGCFVEEIGSVCASMANLIGVHYLGYLALVASWNLKMLDEISRDVVSGEKEGDPRLISFAMTEPDAGTDSQNVEFMDGGTLACHAEKVSGGYKVNGNKIFISCGHLSTWHMLFAYTDLKKASENMVILAVKTDTQGFSFGKREKKMGQKACPASELIFRDCFVPDHYVLLDQERSKKLNRSPQKTTEQVFAYIWAASRMGVSGFGVGIARGALEEALRFASETEIDGKLLINQEWCQHMLAEMYKNVAVGRLTYLESAYANGMHGVSKLVNAKPIYYLLKYSPFSLIDSILVKVLQIPLMNWMSAKLGLDFQSDEEIDRIDGWGSLAKFVGTDAGVQNSRMALEIMGQAGIRHDQKVEKLMRDGKLYQIYEGTNQINRINLFKRFMAKTRPGTECFPANC